MINAKSQCNQKYRGSLYSNLLVGCVLSERIDKDPFMNPKMVVKEDPFVPQPLIRQQQTFIMRWNPEISSHKLVDFEHAMEDFYTEGFYYDWSIFDYKKVHIGDRFFMLKVGNGNTGIVMSGIIISSPYRDKDWSGKGRATWYVRMLPDCMIHPNKSKMVSIQTLNSALPGVNWNEGHSGVLLNKEQAIKFNEIWYNYTFF